MVFLRRFLDVASAWAFLSLEINVDGFVDLCPNSSAIDLTKDTPDSSGLVKRAGKIFLPQAMSEFDGERFGCSCDSVQKLCLRLCCPFGEVQIYGNCVKKNDTDNVAHSEVKVLTDYGVERKIVSESNFLLHDDHDPCDFGWMNSFVTTNFILMKNGSIEAKEWGELCEFENYCLFRNKNSADYSAKVCYPWVTKFSWDIICMVIATLVMFVIFLVYAVLPEMKNLHGMMLGSYSASYVCIYVCAIVVELSSAMKNHPNIFTVSLFIMEYLGGVCVFWLNVMGFDIWRSVRSLRSIDSQAQERKKRKYIWYAIYAWILPAPMMGSYAAAIYYVPQLNDVINCQIFRKYARIAVKCTIFLCNTFFYLSTAAMIKRHKKDTANLTNGVNKHHEPDKQWINLYVKLYVIMGGLMIPWISWDIWPGQGTTSLVVGLEVVHAILLFIVFIWKDNVKRSLIKQFRLGF